MGLIGGRHDKVGGGGKSEALPEPDRDRAAPGERRIKIGELKEHLTEKERTRLDMKAIKARKQSGSGKP